MLETYDTTPPAGRVRAEFLSTSNPEVIKATVTVHDDTQIVLSNLGIGYSKGIYGDQMIKWIAKDLNEKEQIPAGKPTDPQFSLATLEPVVVVFFSVHK